MNPEVQEASLESTKPATDAKISHEESKDKEMQEEDKTESTTNEKHKNNDEFFDLTTIVPLQTIDIKGDGSIIKLVVTEGFGAFIDLEDVVFYRHETRFDNG